jgi:hypothetical protein
MPPRSGEGMTDSPTGVCPPSGHQPRSTHTEPSPPTLSERPKPPILSPPFTSVRRAASTSRASGRSAVDPAGRSWTPTPFPARHKEAEEPKKKIHDRNYGVDRTHPFRDDCQEIASRQLPASTSNNRYRNRITGPINRTMQPEFAPQIAPRVTPAKIVIRRRPRNDAAGRSARRRR